jgi:hypothetical protein
MRLTARFLLLLVILAIVPIAFVLPAGCSGQGEGERCDVHADNNGNDDCAGDLVCTAGGNLNGSNNTDRCCPADRTKATTLVCQLPTAGGIDTTPPPDASTDAPAADAAVSDAPASDAPVDTADAPSDAPVDAAEDGG